MKLSRRRFLTGAVGATFVGSDVLGDDLRWYDVHMHVVGGRERQFGQTVEAAIAAMDEFGVAKAVVFPPPTPRVGLFDYADYAPELRRYPDRFGFLAGGGILNPMLHQFRAEDVTSAIKQQWIDISSRMLDAGLCRERKSSIRQMFSALLPEADIATASSERSAFSPG